MTSNVDTSQDRTAQSPLHLLNCTLDNIRSRVQPFLPNQRSLLSRALPKPTSRRPAGQLRRREGVSFRGSNFAAAIPGDGVVEQVFTSGISSFLNLYNTVLIGRIILTWFPNAPPAIVQPLSTVTDPYLNLFRGIIPPIGGTFDLSPILAFVALDLFTNAAAALPCEMDDGKVPEQSQANSNPLQMLAPSRIAMSLRTRMARNRRQKQQQRSA